MAMTMPSGAGESSDIMVEINTTPLIDVMLVLLIMLILTIPIQTHAVKLDMPTPSNASPAIPPLVVQVDVDEQGVVAWNGLPLNDRTQLETHLTEAATSTPPTELHLRADAKAPYRSVAMVMASAQRLGVTRIGLVGNERFAQ
ncbi:biopolymer transporter ExbD [Pandoraea fibrosis]|uniref:Biopolymer transporter ExbD n=1 Tax=Pandoraea fibrosis TaxID=1891094 RepID=A0ABX6HNB0_9BURK|nr:biopolymer transporter ExbD [Pandoraea fibrosis]QHE91193.1 biopolymer transporter ExbD [Pandoraea fibrosis]QHF12024.1 biopolymer transporter ExbD [Pandoraea fibrosis]